MLRTPSKQQVRDSLFAVSKVSADLGKYLVDKQTVNLQLAKTCVFGRSKSKQLAVRSKYNGLGKIEQIKIENEETSLDLRALEQQVVQAVNDARVKMQQHKIQAWETYLGSTSGLLEQQGSKPREALEFETSYQQVLRGIMQSGSGENLEPYKNPDFLVLPPFIYDEPALRAWEQNAEKIQAALTSQDAQDFLTYGFPPTAEQVAFAYKSVVLQQKMTAEERDSEHQRVYEALLKKE